VPGVGLDERERTLDEPATGPPQRLPPAHGVWGPPRGKAGRFSNVGDLVTDEEKRLAAGGTEGEPTAPDDPLWTAVAFLSGAVERLAVGDDPPRERVHRALELVSLAERDVERLPLELRDRLAHVRDWVRLDPTLEALSERDVVYVCVGIVRAFHEAVRLHATFAAAAPEQVH